MVLTRNGLLLLNRGGGSGINPCILPFFKVRPRRNLDLNLFGGGGGNFRVFAAEVGDNFNKALKVGCFGFLRVIDVFFLGKFLSLLLSVFLKAAREIALAAIPCAFLPFGETFFLGGPLDLTIFGIFAICCR